MKLRSQIVAPLFALVFCAGGASADTLLIERVQQESAGSRPARGLSMAQVEARFGQPQQKLDPTGGQKRQWPTINRWVYPGYTVYFERDRVIDVVARQGSPTETGPKPVAGNTTSQANRPTPARPPATAPAAQPATRPAAPATPAASRPATTPPTGTATTSAPPATTTAKPAGPRLAYPSSGTSTSSARPAAATTSSAGTSATTSNTSSRAAASATPAAPITPATTRAPTPPAAPATSSRSPSLAAPPAEEK